MLKALHIKNLAIIEDVVLEFEQHFTVLTGETGAGKSILIDGLSLALGERADKEMIRAESDEARIEAVFDIGNLPDVKALLADLDVPSEEDAVLLRRVLSTSGKSRCAVNGSPVPLGTLKQIGDRLVDLHGQHEHQLLLDPATHVLFLDAFGRLLGQRAAVGQAWRRWHEARQALAALVERDRDRAQRLDLLQFQVTELESARLEPGEEERLGADKLRLAHARKLGEALGRAHEALVGEGGALESTGAALLALKSVVEFDRAGVGPEADALTRAQELLRENGTSLRTLQERLDDDPGRLEQIEERLDVLARMKRKYGETLALVLAHLERARAEVRELASLEEQRAQLAEAAEAARRDLSARAATLSAERSRAANAFATRVAKALRELVMEQADFGVRITQNAQADGPVEVEGSRYAATAEGVDVVEFYLAPNVGEGTKPLRAIASGGELSRIMLALKSVLAGVDRVGTMVFDEIDAGIGGRVAEVVGRTLRDIGAERQVICITHLPQIAARGARHLAVRKRTEQGHTRVSVTPLEGKARVEELARMLAGEAVTPTALKHAAELLKGG